MTTKEEIVNEVRYGIFLLMQPFDDSIGEFVCNSLVDTIDNSMEVPMDFFTRRYVEDKIKDYDYSNTN